MSSCGSKAHKLKKMNRALLEQLKSNSVLLESRLRKLKHNLRNSNDMIQPIQHNHSSSLRKRHKSWKMRNYSGQVSEVLNPKFAMEHSSSESAFQGEILEDDENLNHSTANGTRGQKESIPNGSFPHFNKHLKSPTKMIAAKEKSSLENELQNTDKNVVEHHKSKNVYKSRDQDKAFKILTDSEEDVAVLKHKISDVQCGKKAICHMTLNKVLQEAGNILDYAPKSTFLQKLKESSQRKPSNSIRLPRKSINIRSQSPLISISPLTKSGKKSLVSTVESQGKFSVQDSENSSPVSSAESATCYACPRTPSSQVFNTSVSKVKENPGFKKKKNSKQQKKKRVCYRRNCYCRKALQSTSSKKRTAKKENKAEESYEVHKSSSSSSNIPWRYCKLCYAHSKLNSTACEYASAMKTPEEKYTTCCCTCQETRSWFDNLRKFRDSHWFDCHAKPVNLISDPDDHKIWQNHHCKCYQEDQHTCLHQYVMNDRLFMQPLNADHKGRSRCAYCHLPRNKERASRFSQETAENPKEEVLVRLPISLLSSQNKEQNQSNEKAHKTKMREWKLPLPANSLALRFQKGIV